MALRNQPYIPLYVQDFMTDEKLIECSASATGVYIRLICIMHKSSQYGKVLLKQKHKQSDKQIKNFASQLSRQMPYSIDEIELGLSELIDEGVIELNGDCIVQGRMVKDNDISQKRSNAGKKGGDSSKLAQANYEAKAQANSEDENINENINRIELREEIFKSEVLNFKNYPTQMLQEFINYWTEPNKSGTKMLWELKPTWDLKRRLERWASNAKVTKQIIESPKPKKSSNTDRILNVNYDDPKFNPNRST